MKIDTNGRSKWPIERKTAMVCNILFIAYLIYIIIK